MIEYQSIKGYENIYEINSQGDVISVKYKKVRKPNLTKFGYYRILLMNNGYKKNEFIHRLVAFAFIPNPENKPFINHKNGIKTDNRVENLEWVTKSENARHSFRIGLQSNKGLNNPRVRLTIQDVNEIRVKYSLGGRIIDLCGEYSVSTGCIAGIVHNRNWTSV